LRALIAFFALRRTRPVFCFPDLVNRFTARIVFFVFLASVLLALFALVRALRTVFDATFAARFVALRLVVSNFLTLLPTVFRARFADLLNDFDAFRTLFTAFARSLPYAIFLRRVMCLLLCLRVCVVCFRASVSRIAFRLQFSPILSLSMQHLPVRSP
jgi:hypothetical protein